VNAPACGVDGDYFGLFMDPNAGSARALRKRFGRLVGAGAPILRAVRRSGEIAREQSRHEPFRVLGLKQLRRDTHRVLEGDVADEDRPLFGGLCEEEVAHLPVVR